MMEHILMHDWYDNKSSDNAHFVKEEDIDNCATERILRNEFHDPLVSSDSEDECRAEKNINWDRIFKKRNQPLTDKKYVACLRRSPPYPRVSELNPDQHKQFLKIISAEYPNVLKDLFLGKPTKQDVKAFEAAKDTYIKEQKEYQKWAKSLWLTDHCIRTLRPGRIVESVYMAECQMKAQRLRGYPNHYSVAAHIKLEHPTNNCDAVLTQDLIKVTLSEMPSVQIPDKIDKQFGIVTPWAEPKPCQKHQYQIVLPNDDALSMLPITEIHHVLATFALKNNTRFIASENALKCLTQQNRHWLLPLSVCDTMGPGGNRVKVLVLDSEFCVHKEAAHMRTYKAFRHLVELALIPLSEKRRIWEIGQTRAVKKEIEGKVSLTSSPELNVNAKSAWQDMDVSSDDEDHLVIDTGAGSLAPTEQELTGFASPNAGTEPSTSGISPKVEPIDEPSTSLGPPPAKQSRRSTDLTPRRSPRISRNSNESPARISGNSTESPARISGKSTESPARISGKSTESPARISGNSTESPARISGKSTESPARISGKSTESPARISGKSTESPARISGNSTESPAWVSGHVTEHPARTYSLFNEVDKESAEPEIGVFSCTCKGTLYEKPPRRSFRKWQFSNEDNQEMLDIIIHCPHKAKDETGELLLEPIPEYQLDLGASEQTPDAVRSVALALALRKNASLLNVRVDGPTGEVATFEKLTSEAFAKRHPGVTQQVISTVHTALSQLQALKPGHYLLQHEPNHGPNAMLMVPLSPGQTHTLELNFDPDELIRVDEADIAKTPPTITTALLPFHKHRRVLPCAFTPYKDAVAKQTKKPYENMVGKKTKKPFENMVGKKTKKPPRQQLKKKGPPPPQQPKKKTPPLPQPIKYPKRKRRKNKDKW